ncbi:hypothetical protein CROQUDRAFT_89514 [Cronartium quercuum f. sp. fusiforme G11]|uniref:Uncharacterized protein n=1 Tax=Cronartium quercuum f. sp. fusiforme G11 TaxID=708437 RepID=A0A9P6NLD5_9BASI|nr:hypothetical protein CROQUDRAFT_89514 [Cronartium quercuum f. sp. fusiforme G11]
MAFVFPKVDQTRVYTQREHDFSSLLNLPELSRDQAFSRALNRDRYTIGSVPPCRDRFPERDATVRNLEASQPTCSGVHPVHTWGTPGVQTVCSSPRPDLAAANQDVFGGHTGSHWCLRRQRTGSIMPSAYRVSLGPFPFTVNHYQQNAMKTGIKGTIGS